MAPSLLNHLCEVFLDQVSSLGNNFCWNHSAVRKWLTGCVIENDGLSQPVGAQASQMSLYRSHLLNAKCRSLQLILSWRTCCAGFEVLTWLFRDLRLAETSSLRGVLGVIAPGTTSVSSRRICLRSPHHSEMSALSLATSPSLSFILTLTAPSLPELHKRQVCFFTLSLVGSSFAMRAPLVLPAVTLGRRSS